MSRITNASATDRTDRTDYKCTATERTDVTDYNCIATDRTDYKCTATDLTDHTDQRACPGPRITRIAHAEARRPHRGCHCHVHHGSGATRPGGGRGEHSPRWRVQGRYHAGSGRRAAVERLRQPYGRIQGHS